MLPLPSSSLPPEQFQESDADDAARIALEIVGNDLQHYSTQVHRELRPQGAVTIRGRLLGPSETLFPRWLREFNRRGYTPFLRPLADGQKDEVELRVAVGVASRSDPRVWINGVLFALTMISTLFVGALYGDAAATATRITDFLQPRLLLSGWPFAATLLGILTAHEFGHYFAARFHRVRVTLPYFIPMPFGFGTLGAFIRMNEPVPDRRKLFDIGVAGPLAGLVVALPLLFVGLSTSPMLVPPVVDGAMLEGNSLIYYGTKYLVFGKTLPNALTGEDVLMNQVTFAAWIGLLVTAINLLPVGQLDGGHTVFAMFGERARYINMATLALMTVLGVASLGAVQMVLPGAERIGFNGWFIWLILIFTVIGPFHPPALDDVTELDGRRKLVGYLVILVFILTFVPVPMRLV